MPVMLDSLLNNYLFKNCTCLTLRFRKIHGLNLNYQEPFDLEIIMYAREVIYWREFLQGKAFLDQHFPY